MIRCRKCNTELTEQAHYCNVCGFPQSPDGSELEKSTPNEQETPAPTPVGDKTLTGSSQPSKSLTPTRSIQPGTRKPSSSEESGNNPIRPKTAKRQLIFPTRPTNNGVKSPAAIPQLISSQPELSPNAAASATLLNSSSSTSASDAPELTSQPEISNLANPPTPTSSAKGESISTTPTQPLGEPSVPARSPELIRTVVPKSFVHSVIPSRPDTAGTTTTQQSKQTPTAPGYPIPVPPTKISSIYDLDESPANSLPAEHVNGQNGLDDTPTMDLLSPESFVATSKAAEHWRKSWRDRQYAEAGPAENVSRGQASVPMPLMPMQQNFARMRAIDRKNKQQQHRRTIKFGTWITIFLMICLIAGLGTYIIVSYLPNSPFGVTHVITPVNTTQPTLTVAGTTSQTFKIGQTIQLHGAHFGANHSITFLLDTATPIVDTSGKNISARANSQGAFDATLSIDSHWTTGSHSIEAVDNSSNQNAYLTLEVIPAGTPATKSTELSVTMDGKPVTMLTFKAVIGQANPSPQRITITNTSGAPLNWSTAVSSNNHLSWLIINNNNTYGQLAISQPHDMLINVNIAGLKSTPETPYTGQIVFTINDNQLLTLPVQLQIAEATPEMVFSPNPIIAQRGPGNTCILGVTLTLINLGTVAISWAVNPDDNIKDNIKFFNNGKPLESGTLLPSGSFLPSGQPGDTVVLSLQCNAIQVGRRYHVSVYANQISWSEYVIVQ